MRAQAVLRACAPSLCAIAETLSDMDAEVTALGGELSTAREVKAGTMSVLLTGKVKLVCDVIMQMIG